MRTFEGKRTRRPRAMAAAFAVLPIAGLVGWQRVEWLPWLMIGAMVGFYALAMISMIPRRATLGVDGRLANASWRARPLRIDRVEVGAWVLGGLDTPTGAMLVLIGDDGARVRVGGRGHDGAGYAHAARARGVDLAIGPDDFDELARMLGVARGAPALAVELIASSQTAGGVLRTMLPWIVTMIVLSGFGVMLSLTGAAERLMRIDHGTTIMAGATIAIAVLGLIVTMARSMRLKRPAWIVREDRGGLVLARGDDDGEEARAPWTAVRAQPRCYLVRSRGGSRRLAALVLAIGERELTISSFEAGADWPAETPRTKRAPRWLAGGAQWAALIATLREHGALRDS